MNAKGKQARRKKKKEANYDDQQYLVHFCFLKDSEEATLETERRTAAESRGQLRNGN